MVKRGNLKCVDDPGIVDLAEGLKSLSDPNRLRIVCLLLKGERCVCEVERELNISQQLASHHLNVLKESGFLFSRKKGTSSYYSVDRARLERITGTFLTYLDYKEEARPAGGDFACCGGTGGTRSKG